MKKLLYLLVFLSVNAYSASIGSTNDLTNLGNGVYQLPSGKNNGFITTTNGVLNAQWYAEMTMELGPNFRWGSSEYGQGDHYFANVKVFRMWNPGSTKENCYVEFSGREGNGVFKFACENTSGGNSYNEYSSDNLKSILKAGTKHRLQFDFKDSSANGNNGRFRMWLNGTKIMEESGFNSLTNGGLKRIFILGMQNEWGSGSGNVVTFSNLKTLEGQTYEQAMGSPTPTPTATPTPTPLPTISGTATPLPAISGTASETPGWFIKFINRFIAFLMEWAK